VKIQYEDQPNNSVTVETAKGAKHTFDLLIGADGLNSVTRRILFPSARQRSPTNNCAYRAVVPYERIRQEMPHLKDFLAMFTMEVWTGPNGYVIAYPISDGKLFNMVLSHHRPDPIMSVEDVPDEEVIGLLEKEYGDYDPRIRDIISMTQNEEGNSIIAPGSCHGLHL
jgi:salicylate hydroxylase